MTSEPDLASRFPDLRHLLASRFFQCWYKDVATPADVVARYVKCEDPARARASLEQIDRLLREYGDDPRLEEILEHDLRCDQRPMYDQPPAVFLRWLRAELASRVAAPPSS
jgi:hypothetical protein